MSFAATIDHIENRTFSELKVGDSASISRTLTSKDIELFAIMSGDVNPAHVDEEFAKSDMFHKIIAHGMWGGALISTVLGTQLPGPGAIYLSQSLRFRRPVAVGDTITVTVKVVEMDESKHRVTLECQATNQRRRDRDHWDRRGNRTDGKNLARTGHAARGQTAGEGPAVSKVDRADQRAVPDSHGDRPSGPSGFSAGCDRGGGSRPDHSRYW